MGITRRGLLIGSAAVLAACSSTPASPPPSDPAEPLPPLQERIDALEKRHNAFAGVFASDIDSDKFVENRANDAFAMCSTFKAYAAARVLQKASAGELNLTDAVGIEPDDIKPNSPVTEARVGKTMTIAELCAAALQQSDNAAGNWLLRIIGGPSRVTDFARTIGDDRTRLDRWETELNSAIPGDPRDTSTPRALGSGFRSLLVGEGSAVSGSSSRTGCGTTRRRVCGPACHRGGRVPTRPAAATTAAPTTWASSTGRRGSESCWRS